MFIIDSNEDFDVAFQCFYEAEYSFFLQGLDKCREKQRGVFRYDYGRRIHDQVIKLQSNQWFFEAIPAVDDLYNHNKELSYFDAIEKYCTHSRLLNRLREVGNYLAEYKALIELHYDLPVIQKGELEESFYDQPAPSIDSGFTLNERFISKVDYIRIVNVLSEIRAFERADKTIPPKNEVMKKFGNLVGLDLSNYEKALSKGLNETSLENNLEIFKRLEEKMKQRWFDKNK